MGHTLLCFFLFAALLVFSNAENESYQFVKRGWTSYLQVTADTFWKWEDMISHYKKQAAEKKGKKEVKKDEKKEIQTLKQTIIHYLLTRSGTVSVSIYNHLEQNPSKK
jgi:hypothetical protein